MQGRSHRGAQGERPPREMLVPPPPLTTSRNLKSSTDAVVYFYNFGHVKLMTSFFIPSHFMNAMAKKVRNWSTFANIFLKASDTQ